MSTSLPRHLVSVAATFSFLFALAVHADGNALLPDGAAGSYRVLERFGLLSAPQPAVAHRQQKAVVAVHRITPPADGAGANRQLREATVERAAVGAYDVLRRLGLLPMDDSTPRVVPRTQKMRVLVEKSKRRLYVLRDGEPFLEYPVMLGGMPHGPKLQAGDLRTPEGVYTLDWRNPRSRFHKSIHISYPGPLDKQRAEERGIDPGGMIMIHGEHDDPALRRILRRKARDWTEGCIALNNEDMDEIWRVVPDGTPIEIRP